MNPKALQKIGYGMYVIGSRKEDKLNAQIANTVFQITSEPPTVAVSINKKNLTHEYIESSKVFSAAILCQSTPLSFIGRFGFKSGREINKLEGVNLKVGETGAPVVLENATSYIEARVLKQLDMGTHSIFVGEVVAGEILTEEPCMTYEYYHLIKRGTTPATAPSYVAPEKKAPAARYQCLACGYIYDPARGDPENGVNPGTPFEQMSESWVCPVCGAARSQFDRIT